MEDKHSSHGGAGAAKEPEAGSAGPADANGDSDDEDEDEDGPSLPSLPNHNASHGGARRIMGRSGSLSAEDFLPEPMEWVTRERARRVLLMGTDLRVPCPCSSWAATRLMSKHWEDRRRAGDSAVMSSRGSAGDSA